MHRGLESKKNGGAVAYERLAYIFYLRTCISSVRVHVTELLPNGRNDFYDILRVRFKLIRERFSITMWSEMFFTYTKQINSFLLLFFRTWQRLSGPLVTHHFRRSRTMINR